MSPPHEATQPFGCPPPLQTRPEHGPAGPTTCASASGSESAVRCSLGLRQPRDSSRGGSPTWAGPALGGARPSRPSAPPPRERPNQEVPTGQTDPRHTGGRAGQAPPRDRQPSPRGPPGEGTPFFVGCGHSGSCRPRNARCATTGMPNTGIVSKSLPAGLGLQKEGPGCHPGPRRPRTPGGGVPAWWRAKDPPPGLLVPAPPRRGTPSSNPEGRARGGTAGPCQPRPANRRARVCPPAPSDGGDDRAANPPVFPGPRSQRHRCHRRESRASTSGVFLLAGGGGNRQDAELLTNGDHAHKVAHTATRSLAPARSRWHAAGPAPRQRHTHDEHERLRRHIGLRPTAAFANDSPAPAPSMQEKRPPREDRREAARSDGGRGHTDSLGTPDFSSQDYQALSRRHLRGLHRRTSAAEPSAVQRH